MLLLSASQCFQCISVHEVLTSCYYKVLLTLLLPVAYAGFHNRGRSLSRPLLFLVHDSTSLSPFTPSLGPYPNAWGLGEWHKLPCSQRVWAELWNTYWSILRKKGTYFGNFALSYTNAHPQTVIHWKELWHEKKAILCTSLHAFVQCWSIIFVTKKMLIGVWNLLKLQFCLCD